MANRSTASVLGLCTTVVTFLEEHAAEMTAAGLDVDKLKTNLVGKKDKLAKNNDEQEALKRTLVAKTAEAQAATGDAYMGASSTIDAIRGVVGKNHPLGKQATALRTALTRNRTRTAKPAATPPTNG